MHDARQPQGDPLAGASSRPRRPARDEAVTLLARAGLPPPLARPAGRPDFAGDPFSPLLRAAAATPGTVPGALRGRLLQRVAASAADARRLHTQRHADTVATEVAPGVTLRTLYRAVPGRARRPGEPEHVALVELAPRASWSPPGAAMQRECLVLGGQAQVGEQPLQTLDYLVRPAADAGVARWSSDTGALLLLRESAPVEGAPARPSTQHAAGARWDDYAPGIRRRILWQQGAQAAMLYHALPGAAVPRHGHRHDEECLMLAGDFFLDEVLLRRLDYQIAPAGTEHRVAATDTGVVIYAHGDVDLDLR